MCRVLGYLGPKILLADLITEPKNSLVNQSFDPEYHDALQLGGAGLASWENGSTDEKRPLLYHSDRPAFYDRNLTNLCAKVKTNNVLAHVRATGYTQDTSIHTDNCHPFLYPKFSLALAHNGGLAGWREMLQSMLSTCRPEIVAHLNGNTDTEPMYCLLMSQYDDPTADMEADEIVAGIEGFLKTILDLKVRHDNREVAKLKFFLADGNDLVVANMGLGPDYATEIDRGWEELREHPSGSDEHTLAGVVEPVWYLAGHDYGLYGDMYGMGEVTTENPSALIVSSEHLTQQPGDWHQMPFQHVVFFERTDHRCAVRIENINI